MLFSKWAWKFKAKGKLSLQSSNLQIESFSGSSFFVINFAMHKMLDRPSWINYCYNRDECSDFEREDDSTRDSPIISRNIQKPFAITGSDISATEKKKPGRPQNSDKRDERKIRRV